MQRGLPHARCGAMLWKSIPEQAWLCEPTNHGMRQQQQQLLHMTGKAAPAAEEEGTAPSHQAATQRTASLKWPSA